MLRSTFLRLGVPLLAGIGLAAAGVSCTRTAPPQAPAPLLRFSGAEPASALTDVFRRRLPDVRFETTISVSPITAAITIDHHEADIGVAWADVVYTAHALDPARSSLRALALLNTPPHYLLVRAGARIARIADLPGHRVRLTSPGTPDDPRFRLPFRRAGRDGVPASTPGVSSLSELIVGAFGIRPSDLHLANVTPDEALAALRSGAVEAYFSSTPSGDLVRDAVRDGARLVPIDGPPVDELRQRYPFIQRVRVPAGTFAGQRTTLQTVGISLVLVCRADLDPALAYRLTRALIEELEQPASAGGVLGQIALDRVAVTPIPLHAGAARAYREWELFR
ncbi:MAG: TAXI family TRAP transporter solute-binding subunit [Vicinamibacterales bacterium]